MEWYGREVFVEIALHWIARACMLRGRYIHYTVGHGGLDWAKLGWPIRSSGRLVGFRSSLHSKKIQTARITHLRHHYSLGSAAHVWSSSPQRDSPSTRNGEY